jgi:hypothetical protein
MASASDGHPGEVLRRERCLVARANAASQEYSLAMLLEALEHRSRAVDSVAHHGHHPGTFPA